MAGISLNISAVSISTSGLNACWMTETLKLDLKNKNPVYAVCKMHRQQNDKGMLKIRGQKQLCHAKNNEIKVGAVVIISKKTELEEQ